VGTRDILAGLRGSEGDWDALPVDSDRPPSLWRPFTCLDQGVGAPSAAGLVYLSLLVDDDEVLHALAVLRGFDSDWDWPGAGHCELAGAPALAEVVAVEGFAAPRVPHTDWRGPGGGWEVVGGLAAPRAPLDFTNWGRSDIDAWALEGAMIPLAGVGVDQALVLAAVERPAWADCWRMAGAVPRGILLSLGLVVLPAVLGPPSPPSTLFEPEADHPLLLGRLTLGGSASSPSSHKGPSSAQPAASSCGGTGGGGE